MSVRMKIKHLIIIFTYSLVIECFKIMLKLTTPTSWSEPFESARDGLVV